MSLSYLFLDLVSPFTVFVFLLLRFPPQLPSRLLSFLLLLFLDCSFSPFTHFLPPSPPPFFFTFFTCSSVFLSYSFSPNPLSLSFPSSSTTSPLTPLLPPPPPIPSPPFLPPPSISPPPFLPPPLNPERGKRRKVPLWSLKSFASPWNDGVDPKWKHMDFLLLTLFFSASFFFTSPSLLLILHLLLLFPLLLLLLFFFSSLCLTFSEQSSRPV